MAPHRLAIVLSHPTQYYSPWFAYLRRKSPIEFKVFYLWDSGVSPTKDRRFGRTFTWDVDLLSGYKSEFVQNSATDPGTHAFKGLDNPKLIERLREYSPSTVLLFGYRYRSHMRVIRAARREGWRLLFRGDSHLLGHPSPSWIKRFLLRRIFRRFAGFLYVGKANRSYFETFGVSEDRLFFSPHSVDARRFSAPPTKETVTELRNSLGAGTSTQIVLFAGKLHWEKAPFDLLRAFLRCDENDALLLFAGDGEQANRLRSEVSDLGARNVRFLPFANQSEMPLRYAAADLFVLPSTGLYETWGLAVNESMHAGTPCLVSDRVGCSLDLIDHGKTGWRFPAGNAESLSNTLAEALGYLRRNDLREEMKTAIQERISHYTYQQTTDGLLAALTSPFLEPA